MNAETERSVRLEDFIQLARQGKEVQGSIDLRKLTIKQKVHPDETEESTREIDSYILVGDYTFKIKEEAWRIAKVYAMGSMEESLHTIRVNRNIANERLKTDYKRLKDAKIVVDEQYFE